MPGVTKEQIAQAKEIDLLSYLQANEPYELVRSGPNEYRTVSHHSLVISNGLWHWINGGVGGKSALDYLVHVRGLGFVEAVETLCDGRAVIFSFQPVKQTASKSVFTLPPPHADNDRVIAYLQSRGIDREIISACIERGDLYESAKNHNCVFVGRDISGVPRFACMRGTFGNYKQDVEGSDKRYGFCFSSRKPSSRFVAVSESPVDALSAATLRKMNAEAWDRYHYLSLDGTSPLALTQFLKDHPEADHVYLLLDNDHAGRGGMQKIRAAIHGNAALDAQVMMITEEPPVSGKDYNERLQHVLREQRELLKPVRQKQADISR